MPPAASTGTGVDRIDDIGHQHHGRHLAGVAAGLVALGDDDVDALLHVADRLLDPSDQGRDLHALLVSLVDGGFRRRTERRREQRDRMCERDLDLRRAGCFCPTEHAGAQPRAGLEHLTVATHVDAVVGEDLVDVVPMVLADHRSELRTDVLHLVDAGVAVRCLHRHHDVHAVGLAADVLVDPLQFELELVGRERERAEHAHAAGVRHCRDDIATVRERKDRELDAERLRETVLHCVTSIASCTSIASLRARG